MVAGTWAGPESEQLQEAVISFIKTEAAHPGPVCTGPRQPAPALHSCSPEWFPRPAPARCGVASGRGRASCGPLTVICWYLADIYCSGAAVTRQCAACSLQQPATGYGPELSSHIVSSSLAQRAARQHTSYANIVCMWRLVTGPGRSGGQSPPRLLSAHIFLTIPRATRWLNRCTAALTATASREDKNGGVEIINES